jgi:hypothetical protein
MMRKIFLLLICLFFISPAWASEELFGEVSQDATMDLPPAPAPEEIFLFTPAPENDINNPYSVYNGKTETSRQVLKGGIEADMPAVLTTYSKDGSSVSIKSTRKKLGVLTFGDVNSGKKTNSVIGGFAGFTKDRFGIRASVTRDDYISTLAKNSFTVSPSIAIGKNITVSATHRLILDQKGYTDGVSVEYSMKNSKIKLKPVKNLNFELNAATIVDSSNDTTRRFGFNTKYNF